MVSVTVSDTEEISTKGYDFFWPKAVNGYELRDQTDLFFDQDFYNDPRSKHAVYPNLFKYNRGALLYHSDLNPTLPPHQSPLPVLDIDTKPPWLVAKGSLELAQRQALAMPGPFDYQLVPTTQYQPLSSQNLHRKFAQLDTDSLEKDAIRFASKYGLLGRPVTLWSLEDNPVAADKRALVRGESLLRWRGEIEKMGVLLTLWDMVHKEEAGKLGIIHWLNNGSVDIRFKWQRVATGEYKISAWDGRLKQPGFGHHAEIIASRRFFPEFLKAYQPKDVVGPAFSFVCILINYHLRGVTPRLIGWHKDKVDITYIPDTLLDAMWLLFMLEVQGKIKMERCKYCNEWFPYDRKTWLFCSDKHRIYYHRKQKKEAHHEGTHSQEVSE